MSRYCQGCAENRLYLDVVKRCPVCAALLAPRDVRAPEPVRPPEPPVSDLVPLLVGALIILIVAAILVGQKL